MQRPPKNSRWTDLKVGTTDAFHTKDAAHTKDSSSDCRRAFIRSTQTSAIMRDKEPP